jgi:hypothetical protein
MNRFAELQRLIDQKAELIEQLKRKRGDMELQLRVAFVEHEIEELQEQRLTAFERTAAAVQRFLRV